MLELLRVAHIAVLGYWLGAELVINSTYRFVCIDAASPFAARDRLMEHVMQVDQHVRYALVLQAALGIALAALYGFVPGGETLAWSALAVGALWLGFVELVHRLRHAPFGRRLAGFDRAARYVLIVLLLAIAVHLVGDGWAMPVWLRWKLAFFAGVMACGVGIRLALIGHFRVWAQLRAHGSDPANERIIRRIYWRATSVLLLLWVCIAAIVALSVWKPG